MGQKMGRMILRSHFWAAPKLAPSGSRLCSQADWASSFVGRLTKVPHCQPHHLAPTQRKLGPAPNAA